MNTEIFLIVQPLFWKLILLWAIITPLIWTIARFFNIFSCYNWEYYKKESFLGIIYSLIIYAWFLVPVAFVIDFIHLMIKWIFL